MRCTDLAAGTFGQGKWTYAVFAEMRHACSKPSPHQLQRNMCSGSRSGRLFILTARWPNLLLTKDGQKVHNYVDRLLRKMAWSCAKLSCKLKVVHQCSRCSQYLARQYIATAWKRKDPLLDSTAQPLAPRYYIPLPHLQDHMFIKAFQILVRCGQPEWAVGPGCGSV